MENERTENIFYLDLKHVHKYGSAKISAQSVVFFTTNGHRTWRRKKKNKKKNNKK